jgi:ankyrin repeat protein
MNKGYGKGEKRFTVGTKVQCRTGAQEWSAGVIVALDYREDHWPPGKTVPYQVQLDEGALIFVPMDSDQLCRKIVPPWWEVAMGKPGSYYAKNNPSADELVAAAANQDINAKDHKGNSALMKATCVRWPSAMAQLISMKADVDAVTTDQSRAIHFAVNHGASFVKLLVDAKADLNCQDTDPDYDPEFTSTTFGDRLEHRTPLHYACEIGDVESAKVLLAANANADVPDAQMKTPLHLAIEAEENDCIDVLLNAKANVNLGNQSSGMDNTPLMDAAAAGNVEIMQKLIASKADINKQGKQDMSALHLAARNRRVQACEILIAAKADMNQESKCGTALQLARKNGGLDLLKAFDVQPTVSSFGGVTCVSSLDAAQRAALFME